MDALREEEQLLRSCEILFGTELHISSEFLDYFQLSGLKGAYRKRAMETHPDKLFGDKDLRQTGSDENFHKVQQAYEQLLRFLQVRKKSPYTPGGYNPLATGSAAGQRAASTKNPFQHNPCPQRPSNSATRHEYATRGGEYPTTDTFYHGPLPDRPLLFGHFLYYSGLANWRTIARILICQKAERPRVGELGIRFGMLRTEDISCILRNKVPFQPFGQTAKRLGMLSEEQLRVLIFHQQRLQKKFGTILLEKKMIDRHALQELLRQFAQHNASVSNNRPY